MIFQIDHNEQLFPKLDVSNLSNKIGEKVYAIINDAGLFDKKLSDGILSGFIENDNLIQSTTPISIGSAGGPLFNSKGQVIGITTSRVDEANLNNAVDIKMLRLDRFK